MSEQDAVFLIYLPTVLLLYMLFSGHYQSTVLGRPPPTLVRGYIKRLFTGTPPSRRTAFGAYVGWTAFTQLVPLIVAFSDTTGFVRVAGVGELVGASAWTAYLLWSN